MNQKNIEAEVVEGERLMLAVGLWKGIASHHLCGDHKLASYLLENYRRNKYITQEELIGPNVFGYTQNLNFSQPPGVPTDFDPSKVSVFDTPTDGAGKLSASINSVPLLQDGAAIEQNDALWPISETKIQVENYLFEINHWLHAKAAFQLLGIHGVDVPKDALKLATLQALTEIMQPVLDKHQGPKLPTNLLEVSDPQHQSVNIPLVAKTYYAPAWRNIHGYYEARGHALDLQLFKEETIGQVFRVTAVLFMILMTTLSLPAVGVGRYWLGAGISFCLSIVLEEVIPFMSLDIVFRQVVSLTPMLLLVSVLLAAAFQVIRKYELILLCASIFAIQPLTMWLSLPTHVSSSGQIVILAILLLLNVLVRIIFARLRSLPDAN